MIIERVLRQKNLCTSSIKIFSLNQFKKLLHYVNIKRNALVIQTVPYLIIKCTCYKYCKTNFDSIELFMIAITLSVIKIELG